MQNSRNMGQALRRATGMVRRSPPAPSPSAPPQSRISNVERMPSAAAGRANPQIGSQDRLGVAIEDSEVFRPGDASTLEERDSNYDAMLSQLIGKVSAKPGGKLEMGEAFFVEKYDRQLPKVRSSKADEGLEEKKVQAPGTLKAGQLREILLLYYGKSEQHEGKMSVEDIAHKFRMDTSHVQKILQYVSLPSEANHK